MRADQVRTVILKNNDLVALHTALDLLRSGSGLTSVQSGVSAEDPIAGGSLADGAAPVVFFDGFTYVMFIFITGAT